MGRVTVKGRLLILRPRRNPRTISCIVSRMQPSIHVRNLVETAVLHLQHSPDLSEEEVRWIQQFAAHLITEFSVLKEGCDLLYAPLEDQTPSVDNIGITCE